MRLTKFDIVGEYGCADRYERYDDIDLLCEIYQKLGQLEDIEEELGVDLITLFKALKNGIWVNGLFINKEKRKCLLDYYESVEEFMLKIDSGWLSICDYGKSWVLTKEELE